MPKQNQRSPPSPPRPLHPSVPSDLLRPLHPLHPLVLLRPLHPWDPSDLLRPTHLSDLRDLPSPLHLLRPSDLLRLLHRPRGRARDRRDSPLSPTKKRGTNTARKTTIHISFVSSVDTKLSMERRLRRPLHPMRASRARVRANRQRHPRRNSDGDAFPRYGGSSVI